MAWDGNGSFTRTKDWTNDRDAGIKILATRHDDNDDELTSGIGACLTKNNESKPTADFKPNADATYSLGSSALRWVNGWMQALKLKTGATYVGTVQSTNLTADRTIELPDQAGTIALTSNVTLRNQIDGCKIANGTDATNDINVSAGICADSTNTVLITVAAMAGKQLDANWAPGAAAGMRNSAVGIANATYHIYAVAKADGTQDIYAHTSTTVATVITALQAESGGSAYVYARRIASIVRAGATILAFIQYGDLFMLGTFVTDISVVNPGAIAVARTLASVPIGLNVEVILQIVVGNTAGAGAVFAYMSDLATTDSTPSSNMCDLPIVFAGAGAVSTAGTVKRVMTDTSARVRSRLSYSDANCLLNLNTLGWIDQRGRNA